MKYVFLDFDGVFNYRNWWNKEDCQKILVNLGGMESHFDPVCVKYFNQLIDEYLDIRIILSTSWRHISQTELDLYGNYPNGLQSVFDNIGLRAKIYDRTLVLGTRDVEIMRYINDHCLINESYVIIDDDDYYSESEYRDILLPHFVHTNYFGTGFDETSLKECMEVLR